MDMEPNLPKTGHGPLDLATKMQGESNQYLERGGHTHALPRTHRGIGALHISSLGPNRLAGSRVNPTAIHAGGMTYRAVTGTCV